MYVFIDTQVYMQKNFSFNKGLLAGVTQRAQDGLITLLMTDIIKKEIESNIYKQVHENVSNVAKKFNGDAKILKNLNEFNEFYSLLDSLDHIYGELIDYLDKFIVESNIEVISTDDVSPSEVFDNYFNRKPPFSGKKKSEFPDAFTLIALENYAKINDYEIVVISGDDDLKDFCKCSSKLKYEGSLEALFDKLNQNNEYLHQLIISKYVQNIDELTEYIGDKFNGFWFDLMNEDGEIENIEYESISIDAEPYILEIKRNEESQEVFAKIAFEAEIDYLAQVNYYSYDNAFYDKEDGKYYMVDFVERSVEGSLTVPIQLEMSIDLIELEVNEYDVSEFNEGQSIEIYV